jgi:hypothetical protein
MKRKASWHWKECWKDSDLQQFSSQFQYFLKYGDAFSLSSTTLIINVKTVQGKLQRRLQYSEGLKSKFEDITLLDLYNFIYPVISLKCSETIYNRWQAFLKVYIVRSQKSGVRVVSEASIAIQQLVQIYFHSNQQARNSRGTVGGSVL